MNPDAAIRYPIEFPVKVMGRRTPRLVRTVIDIVKRHAPDFDPATVETNFIGVDVASIGIDPHEAKARIEEQGVLVGFLRPGVLRVAVHLGVTDEDVDRAIELIPRGLGVLVAA